VRLKIVLARHVRLDPFSASDGMTIVSRGCRLGDQSIAAGIPLAAVGLLTVQTRERDNAGKEGASTIGNPTERRSRR
jgi:hypothetical protein